ncbi:hypothetical protein C8R47DRAFT_1167511, partial [Mycena vitilis]
MCYARRFSYPSCPLLPSLMPAQSISICSQSLFYNSMSLVSRMQAAFSFLYTLVPPLLPQLPASRPRIRPSSAHGLGSFRATCPSTVVFNLSVAMTSSASVSFFFFSGLSTDSVRHSYGTSPPCLSIPRIQSLHNPISESYPARQPSPSSLATFSENSENRGTNPHSGSNPFLPCLDAVDGSTPGPIPNLHLSLSYRRSPFARQSSPSLTVHFAALEADEFVSTRM